MKVRGLFSRGAGGALWCATVVFGSVLPPSRWRAALVALALITVPQGHPGTPAAAASSTRLRPFPAILDPRVVREQDEMTWADYTPIPGAEWASTNRQGSVKQIRVAIVTADFPDQPFVMTLPRHSDLYGNPQIDPVTRDVIPNFYADFYNKPLPVNRGHTIHEYWMEQSRGRIGVTVAAFGPYRMPLKVFQYGGLTELDLPDGHSQSSGLSRQLDSLWRADRGDTITRGFDVVLRLFAVTTRRPPGRNSAR